MRPLSFLLTNRPLPEPFRIAPETSTAPLQSDRKHVCGNFSLYLGGAARFAELPYDPFADSTSSGPFWIVLEGFISGKLDYAQLEEIAHLVQTKGLHALESVNSHLVLLLAAPARGWFLLQKGFPGARSAFRARSDSTIALASQAHLIAALPGISRAPDPAFMASMLGLQLVAPGGRTPFESIKELEPGETIQGIPGNVSSTKSTVAFRRPASRRSAEEWVEEFRYSFDRAVLDVMPADKPPGVLLSGGLDSGPVAAVAAQHLSRSGERIATVSWRLPTYPKADEWQYIKQVGKSLDARMHSFGADHLLPFSEVSVTVETPVFNAFDPLLRECYRTARNHGLDSLLSGGAGDGIYPDYRWTMYDNLRRREIRLVSKALMQSIGSPVAGKFTRFPPLRYLIRRLVKGKSPAQARPAHWLTPHAGAHFIGCRQFSDEVLDHPYPEYANRLTSNWLAGHSAAENATAESFGISRRDPFLNQDLIQLMLAMPMSMTFREGQAKWQMRQAMKLDNALPRSILEKPRTGLLYSFFDAGFEQARPWLADVLLRQESSWREWVRPKFIEHALYAQRATSEQKLVATRCLGYCLWRKQVEQLSSTY